MFERILIVVPVLMIMACSKEIDKPDNLPDVIKSEDVMVSSIIDNPIIFEALNFKIKINNNETKISKIEAYVGEVEVAKVEGSTELEVNLNPEILPAGDTSLKVKITDINKTISQLDYPISIHRKLMEIDLPAGFLTNQYSEFIFFASAMDGTLLASKKVAATPISFQLTTPSDISVNTPYTLTYVTRYVDDYFNQTNIFTISEITSETFPKYTPQSPPRDLNARRSEYNTSGFSENDVINIGTIFPSFGYSFGYDSPSQKLLFTELEKVNSGRIVAEYYLPVRNWSQDDYAYTWLTSEDLSSDFVFDINSLSRDGIEKRTLDASYNDGLGDGRYGYLSILGYTNEQDFNDGVFHYVWQNNHGIDAIFPSINTISYFFNSTFEKYSHTFQWEDYYTKRIGEPLNAYDIPIWSFDYVQNGRIFDIYKNGEGHNLGRMIMSNLNDQEEVDGKRTLYNWQILFDSKNTNNLILPELPEEMKDWEFGKIYGSKDILIERMVLYNLEGIPNYSEYLNSIIKNNESTLKITPKVEAKFKNRRGNAWVIESDHFIY